MGRFNGLGMAIAVALLLDCLGMWAGAAHLSNLLRGYWLMWFMALWVNLGLVADLCGASLMIPLPCGWCGLKGLKMR